MMITFESAIRSLEYMGVSDVLIPFIIIFSLVFMALNKISLFRGHRPGLLAAALAAGPVIAHVTNRVPPCWDVVVMINNAFPTIGLVLVFFVFLSVLVGIFGFEMNFIQGALGWISILVITFVVYTMVEAPRAQCGFDVQFALIPLFPILLPIAVFAGLVWFITRGGGGDDDDYDIY